MTSLADQTEIVGFFSYSRDDDSDSDGALSNLRRRIQNELRAQLGRSQAGLRLWQDVEAIAPGVLWESQTGAAIAQSVFFIPIITPRVIRSRYCREEFQHFLDRETRLGRADLVFPIIYIEVPELKDEAQWRGHPVLDRIGTRQYVDWTDYRFEPDSPKHLRAIAGFSRTIVVALTIPMPPTPPKAKAAPAMEEPASGAAPSPNDQVSSTRGTARDHQPGQGSSDLRVMAIETAPGNARVGSGDAQRDVTEQPLDRSPGAGADETANPARRGDRPTAEDVAVVPRKGGLRSKYPRYLGQRARVLAVFAALLAVSICISVILIVIDANSTNSGGQSNIAEPSTAVPAQNPFVKCRDPKQPHYVSEILRSGCKSIGGSEVDYYSGQSNLEELSTALPTEDPFVKCRDPRPPYYVSEITRSGCKSIGGREVDHY